MPGAIATIPQHTFYGSSAPLAGGFVEVYLAGTTTPATTWQNEALTIVNTWPIELDALGQCSIWLDDALSYKVIVKDRAGVTKYTREPVVGGGVDDSFALDVAALEAAVVAAAGSADAAATSEGAAAVSATASQTARVGSEAAMEAAQISSSVYPTLAEGLAATAEDHFFSVPADDDDEYLILYQVQGGEAVERSRYPSVEAFEALSERFTTLERFIAALVPRTEGSLMFNLVANSQYAPLI